ncbi:transporter protein SMF2 [Fusarium oxysporum]|nr:transporter protein SMF2 [Fusarium oxysporum]
MGAPSLSLNPNSSDLATNEDFNGLVNSRAMRQDDSSAQRDMVANGPGQTASPPSHLPPASAGGDADRGTPLQRLRGCLLPLGLIGPGFMISVPYIDPGTYSTDNAAGASYTFHLLFVVLLSNQFAIFSRARPSSPASSSASTSPRTVVIVLAVALNFLISRVSLLAGYAISMIDVLVSVVFYRPEGPIKGLRIFFCIQISLIHNTSPGQVFKGYLPSSSLYKHKRLADPNPPFVGKRWASNFIKQ